MIQSEQNIREKTNKIEVKKGPKKHGHGTCIGMTARQFKKKKNLNSKTCLLNIFIYIFYILLSIYFSYNVKYE